MSIKLTITIETINLYSAKTTTHFLIINVNTEVVKNIGRLKSHCATVVRKSYGRNAKIIQIRRGDTGEIYV